MLTSAVLAVQLVVEDKAGALEGPHDADAVPLSLLGHHLQRSSGRQGAAARQVRGGGAGRGGAGLAKSEHSMKQHTMVSQDHK